MAAGPALDGAEHLAGAAAVPRQPDAARRFDVQVAAVAIGEDHGAAGDREPVAREAPQRVEEKGMPPVARQLNAPFRNQGVYPNSIRHRE